MNTLNKSKIQAVASEVLNPHPNKQTLQVVMIVSLIALTSVAAFTAGVTVGNKIETPHRLINSTAISNDDTMIYYNKLSKQIEIATRLLGAALDDQYLKNPEDAKTFMDEMHVFK